MTSPRRQSSRVSQRGWSGGFSALGIGARLRETSFQATTCGPTLPAFLSGRKVQIGFPKPFSPLLRSLRGLDSRCMQSRAAHGPRTQPSPVNDGASRVRPAVGNDDVRPRRQSNGLIGQSALRLRRLCEGAALSRYVVMLWLSIDVNLRVLPGNADRATPHPRRTHRHHNPRDSAHCDQPLGDK
jgi:hypothetical protein